MPSAKRFGTTRPICHSSQFQYNKKSLAGCVSVAGAGSGSRIYRIYPRRPNATVDHLPTRSRQRLWVLVPNCSWPTQQGG